MERMHDSCWRSATWFCFLLTLFTIGCTGVGGYFVDRGRDATDVIDLKYGLGVGLGAKLEVTDYAGAGLGAAVTENVTEWFGRVLYQSPMGALHLLAYGTEGLPYDPGFTETTNVFLVSLRQAPKIPFRSRLRVGAELMVPGVWAGMYLNFAELADFFTGIVGVDLMGDDGMPKFTPWYQVWGNGNGADRVRATKRVEEGCGGE